MHIIINKKYLIFGNYKVKCSIGKRGIKVKKREGDLITPKGKFKILFILYRKDRVPNLKSNIKKIIIQKNMGWCDDIRSNRYNQLVTYPFKFSSEKLYKQENIYDVIFVLNYNYRPIKKNKGSAIFIHVARKDFSPTKGCVAIKKNELKKLLKIINKNTKIKIF